MCRAFAGASLTPGALLDLGTEIIEPAILDRVFEPRVLAVLAIAPVTLHGDDGLGNLHGVFVVGRSP